jgi:hypothetical protein
MCDELNDELKEGSRAAIALAKHLISMGANNLQRVVIVEEKEIRVSARIIGPTNKADTKEVL